MHLFSEYKNHLLNCIQALISEGALPDGLKLDAITLEPPRDATHGDMATNAAMVLAGQAKQNPRKIAELLVEKLRAIKGVSQASIAGPGFINLSISADIWRNMIPEIIANPLAFGDSDFGQNAAINVEYVSANPTGPLHIGHARGAVYGDALARLLAKAGYKVTKEYYVNDAGVQIDMLARSTYLRYREACGEVIGEIPEGLYPGAYLKAAGQAVKAAHGEALLKADEADWLGAIKPIAIDEMLALIKDDLQAIGIKHDVFTSEKALKEAGNVEQAIAQLKSQGHLYMGVLPPPKGVESDDWEAQAQLLFRATDFGDDVDRSVAKPNGDYTYFAGDLALTADKISRGFSQLILMLGADHGGYVKRLQAATLALSDNKVPTDVLLCQLVRLTKNGEPVKMSKRSGNFITVREVLDEVGPDILRFVMLMRKSTQDMAFDLAKVKEQSKDNPVFYVQYAHARAHSLLRLAAKELPDAVALSAKPDADLLAHLSHDAELAIIKKLGSFPRMIEQAAIAHEPHRIIYYATELAAMFHELWHVGGDEDGIRFVQSNAPILTAARLSLARAVAGVIASALDVCGVKPVEEL
jgi:arginyl-tRNA synthetase